MNEWMNALRNLKEKGNKKGKSRKIKKGEKKMRKKMKIIRSKIY